VLQPFEGDNVTIAVIDLLYNYLFFHNFSSKR